MTTTLPLLVISLLAAPPPALTPPTGGPHDFDYFEGGWRATQRRLKARGVGSKDWETFPSTLCMKLHLDGIATIDELEMPTKGWKGLTVRTFDLAKKQWSIYWVSSKRGVMDPPQVGGFDGDRGLFYGEDVDDGKPVQVIYEWKKLPPNRARWAQSFSYDGGKTWEVNWTSDFERDASVCKK